MRLLLAICSLLLACLLALAGLALPVHFRAIASEVLRHEARGTLDAPALGAERLLVSQPGPAALALEAARSFAPNRPEVLALQDQRQALLERRPLYRLSGGEAPFFNAFLRDAPVQVEATKLVAQVIPLDHRRLLFKRLSQSPNQNVQTLLKARQFGGWARFSPATDGAGGPLDTAILMSALLAQSSLEPTALDRELTGLVRSAEQGSIQAMRDLENYCMAVLSVGKRLNFLQWRALLQRLDSTESVRRIAALFRAYPEQLPLFYTALLMAGESPERLVDAIEVLSGVLEDPVEPIALTVQMGAGAVQRLLAKPKPLYEAPELLRSLAPLADRVRPAAFTALAARQPGTAAVAKSVSFVLSGVFLLLFFVQLWRLLSGWGRQREAQRSTAWLAAFRYLASGLAVCGVLWALAEPKLLEAETARAELRFDFVFSETFSSLTTSSALMFNEVDQVTLLVLAIFFLVQLVIYAFCLIKIAEIRRQSAPATMKLALIENEDNLFDTGLYVGLGGTVASLILVSMGVVEASLMAAYASTLFGILNTATIKVVHLRPFKRKLIIESDTRF